MREGEEVGEEEGEEGEEARVEDGGEVARKGDWGD